MLSGWRGDSCLSADTPARQTAYISPSFTKVASHSQNLTLIHKTDQLKMSKVYILLRPIQGDLTKFMGIERIVANVQSMRGAL